MTVLQHFNTPEHLLWESAYRLAGGIEARLRQSIGLFDGTPNVATADKEAEVLLALLERLQAALDAGDYAGVPAIQALLVNHAAVLGEIATEVAPLMVKLNARTDETKALIRAAENRSVKEGEAQAACLLTAAEAAAVRALIQAALPA